MSLALRPSRLSGSTASHCLRSLHGERRDLPRRRHRLSWGRSLVASLLGMTGRVGALLRQCLLASWRLVASSRSPLRPPGITASSGYGRRPRCVSASLRLCVDRVGGRLCASGGKGGSASPSRAFAFPPLQALSESRLSDGGSNRETLSRPVATRPGGRLRRCHAPPPSVAAGPPRRGPPAARRPVWRW